MTLRLSDSQLTILAAACGREDGSVFAVTAKISGGALQKVLTSLLGKGLLEEIPATDPETVWRAPQEGGSFTLKATPAAYAALGIEHGEAGEGDATSDTASPVGAKGLAALHANPQHPAPEPPARGKGRRKAARAAQAATQPHGAAEAGIGATAPQGPPVAPAAAKPKATRAGTKQEALIAMLRQPDGASIDEIIAATGWQPHTVRGAIAGALKKKLGLAVASDRIEGRGRVYRLPQ